MVAMRRPPAPAVACALLVASLVALVVAGSGSRWFHVATGLQFAHAALTSARLGRADPLGQRLRRSWRRLSVAFAVAALGAGTPVAAARELLLVVALVAGGL